MIQFHQFNGIRFCRIDEARLGILIIQDKEGKMIALTS